MALRIVILNANGMTEQATVHVSSDPPWEIWLESPAATNKRFVGEDLFDALKEMRKWFETKECLLLCAGARRDVYPSGMARSMGSARKAYVHEMGKPTSHLVDIFEPAEADQIGTVDEQEKFRREWISSLMNLR